MKDLRPLLEELRKLSKEIEWVEFKKENANPQLIGEYISALSNSAALEDKTYAYMVWGLDDSTHEIVGTQFDPKHTKKGNEELESWLLRLLEPKIDFRFNYVSCENDKTVVVLEIKTNYFKHPVAFRGIEYIRIGSYKKILREYPEKERESYGGFLIKFHLKKRLQNMI
ncbi:MAG TPA: ATP-binding protein [Sphaerochaeta sp.]|nr:ATP-binding protein [Sphaerochaeta sp.]HQB54975.1 ATP-binding protein [Sphaerochaeta sp.]